jgi:cytochrome c553
MNKLKTTMFALAVACVTFSVQAQQVTGSVENGSKKTAMCVGCHGIQGYQSSFPEVHKVPKIAGQSATYIVAALGAYKAGDRKHPTMRAIADTLTEQDIADLGAYYAQLGVQQGDALPATAAKAPSERVQALISRDRDNACTKCHGANFNTPNDGTVAKLAGQHADYLFVALKSYKVENNAQLGRSNGVMSGQAFPARRQAACPLRSRFVSIARGVPLHAIDISLAVGRTPGALALPHHAAETLHRVVVGIEQRAATRGQQLDRLADAARLVDGALLADGQVHRQMEKRIFTTVFSVVDANDGSIGIGQLRVVFGMRIDPARRDGFQRFQRLSGTAPGVDIAEEAAHFFLSGIEHAREVSTGCRLFQSRREIACVAARRAGSIVSCIVFALVRLACPLILSAATARPVRSLMGAAIEISPSSSS